MMEESYGKPWVASEDWIEYPEHLFDFKMQLTYFTCLQSTQLCASSKIDELSKLVTKELRVIVITEKVNFVAEDENYVFAKNFVKKILEEHFHDGRKLW